MFLCKKLSKSTNNQFLFLSSIIFFKSHIPTHFINFNHILIFLSLIYLYSTSDLFISNVSTSISLLMISSIAIAALSKLSHSDINTATL